MTIFFSSANHSEMNTKRLGSAVLVAELEVPPHHHILAVVDERAKPSGVLVPHGRLGFLGGILVTSEDRDLRVAQSLGERGPVRVVELLQEVEGLTGVFVAVRGLSRPPSGWEYDDPPRV